MNICALCSPPRGKPSTSSTAASRQRGITANKRFLLRPPGFEGHVALRGLMNRKNQRRSHRQVGVYDKLRGMNPVPIQFFMPETSTFTYSERSIAICQATLLSQTGVPKNNGHRCPPRTRGAEQVSALWVSTYLTSSRSHSRLSLQVNRGGLKVGREDRLGPSALMASSIKNRRTLETGIHTITSIE